MTGDMWCYIILFCAVGYFSTHFANYLVGVLV